MAWCTQAELLKRIDVFSLAKLASEGPVHSLEEAQAALIGNDEKAKIEQAIADGLSEMNLYNIGHLDISDSDTQDSLEWMNAILALYNLNSLRNKKDDDNPFSDRKKLVITQLERINKESLHPVTNSPAAWAVSNKSTTDRVFGRKATCGSATENF